MIKHWLKYLLWVSLSIFNLVSTAATPATKMSFVVSMENPVTHYYHVVLTCSQLTHAGLDLKMCAWTPGYYQILDFAKAVENFKAATRSGETLSWSKPSKNGWHVDTKDNAAVIITYDVKAIVRFVGNIYLDENRGYITAGALFMYSDEALRYPVTINMQPYNKWPKLVATGLDSLRGQRNVFFAPNYDVLYDSPFLMGKLEVLPSFAVKGIPHNFIGYDLGVFDRRQFMDDLKKIVIAGSDIIRDIPYTHYTFLAVGPGAGGIEHLNSTSLSFSNGEGFGTTAGRKKLYSFIAHEYFHNFNVKRIRPIELGPFDYSKENRTNMLWVSEGFTVYYEYIILKKAGLTSGEDLLEQLQSNLKAYENKPGHLFQSATQASYETWSDGPFGRTGDEVNRTISYYDKGPVLGFMLDLKIRHETNNKKSLDDVMRLLYNKYYLTKKRGFTEQEFRQTCESIAGTSLAELFAYAATVKPVNYPKYFAYAGLGIDTMERQLPEVYSGIKTEQVNNNLVIKSVEWNSPAWNAGLKANDKIVSIDGNKPSLKLLDSLVAAKGNGKFLKFVARRNEEIKAYDLHLTNKKEKRFEITPLLVKNKLQESIYNSLLN